MGRNEEGLPADLKAIASHLAEQPAPIEDLELDQLKRRVLARSVSTKGMRSVMRPRLATILTTLAVFGGAGGALAIGHVDSHPNQNGGAAGEQYRPGKGCGDRHHHHFRNDECKRHHHGPPHRTSRPEGASPSKGTAGTTPPTGTATAVDLVARPVGAYTCYQTNQISNTTTYASRVAATVTFGSNGTYQKQDNPVQGDWHRSGSTIVFTSGVLWESANRDLGDMYPSGTSMPHAQPNVPASGYTLVIKDTVQQGGDPPSREFSRHDGPNGSGSLPESFWYCKK